MQYLLWQVVGLSAAILWGTIWSVIIFGPMRIIKIVRPNPEVELKGMERTDPQYCSERIGSPSISCKYYLLCILVHVLRRSGRVRSRRTGLSAKCIRRRLAGIMNESKLNLYHSLVSEWNRIRRLHTNFYRFRNWRRSQSQCSVGTHWTRFRSRRALW